MELVTLAAPVDPPRTVFRIASLLLDVANSVVTVQLRDWNAGTFGARTIEASYTGATAMQMITSLNKANLSTQSLQQRVLTRLLADGQIPSGTQGGAPD